MHTQGKLKQKGWVIQSNHVLWEVCGWNWQHCLWTWNVQCGLSM